MFRGGSSYNAGQTNDFIEVDVRNGMDAGDRGCGLSDTGSGSSWWVKAA